MSEHLEAEYLKAARYFRKLLRTSTYPEGETIRALEEIRKQTRVSRAQAQVVLRELIRTGDLESARGLGSRVLPAPDRAPAEDKPAIIAELRSTITRMSDALNRLEQ